MSRKLTFNETLNANITGSGTVGEKSGNRWLSISLLLEAPSIAYEL